MPSFAERERYDPAKLRQKVGVLLQPHKTQEVGREKHILFYLCSQMGILRRILLTRFLNKNISFFSIFRS